MNDRNLRNIINGLGGKGDGTTRQDGFDITVASEVMAAFCLSNDIIDLKEKLAKMVVAYNRKGEPVTCGQINAQMLLNQILFRHLKEQQLSFTAVLSLISLTAATAL